jgi:hypothetical protein
MKLVISVLVDLTKPLPASSPHLSILKGGGREAGADGRQLARDRSAYKKARACLSSSLPLTLRSRRSTILAREEKSRPTRTPSQTVRLRTASPGSVPG